MKTTVVAALTILATHAPLAAQTPVPPTSTFTSTLSGVYTAEQATRGKDVYAGKCRSCHNPSTGDGFARRWGGKTLLDFLTYLMKTMPSNDPGTVSAEDNTDVIAFLLQATGMPVGEHELPADEDSLKTIRIDVKPTQKDPPRITREAPPSDSAVLRRARGSIRRGQLR